MKPLFTLYEVGGCVRDDLLSLKTKDIDFVAVFNPDLSSSYTGEQVYEMLVRWLIDAGFNIYLPTPEYFTIRAKFPLDHPAWSGMDADVVLARIDGPYSDGRRPDYVLPGSLRDDIFRRDFTVNALARKEDGEIIDLVGGVKDLESRRLRFVGDPMTRIREDALRILRGVRFVITKGFELEPATRTAMLSAEALALFANISNERVREEMNRMLRHDTLATIATLMHDFGPIAYLIFSSGVRLEATLKQ